MRTIGLLLALLISVSAVCVAPATASNATSVALHPVADNYVDSKYPVLGHYGKVTALYVGNSYDHAQNIWGSERIYIRFNLTGLPKNRVIVNATLTLWQYNPPQSNQTYETHRVLGAWNETTQNWSHQPSWSQTKTSETVAPSRGAQGSEVAVKWDITADVKAWYSGAEPNYGTMIKVAKEEHAQDASSGFWSREYPVEKVQPSLTIELQPSIGSAYVVKVGVAGLAPGTPATITVDGESYASIQTGQVETLMLDRGTTHTIAVSALIPESAGVRYECKANEAQVSTDASYVFMYSAEYQVTFSAEPANLFQIPTTGWYAANTTLHVHRTGPDLVEAGPGTRYLFDGWYLNGAKSSTEPQAIVVQKPLKVEGRYITEYYLNVTSPVGETEGSGWYAKDTVASFSVRTATIPAEGPMGLLGLKRTFNQWVGSNNFLGLPTENRGQVVMKGPTTIVAVWEDDWNQVITDLFILFAVVLVAVAIAVAYHKRRGPKMPATTRVGASRVRKGRAPKPS